MPEDLKKLLATAKEAKSAGLPVEEINYEIFQRSDGAAASISALEGLVAAQERPLSSTAGFARALGEGATMSLWDEAAGALAAVVPGGRGYREARDVSRGRYAGYTEEHPKTALLGEMLGGAVIPAVGSGVGAARAGAGLGARIVGGVLGGGIGGGISGGITGVGQAEEVGDVPLNALVGTGIGAAGGALLGGGVPVLGAITKPLAQRAGALLAPDATARWMSRDMLRRAMEDAGIPNAEELVRRAQALPEGSVLADVDPALSRQARAMVNRSGELERAGGPVEALGQRHGTRGQRIARDLEETSGISISYEQGIRDLNDEIATIRREGYDVLEQRMPGGIISNDISNTIQNNPDLLDFAQKSLPGFGVRRPTFREMQDLLIDLRAAANQYETLPGKGRRLLEAYDQLRESMERAFPARPGEPSFADVQARMALTYEKAAAYELGAKKAWGMRAREVREAVLQMPEGVRESFRIGYLDKLETELRKKAAGGATAQSLLDANAAPEIFERLQPLFTDDASMRAFMSRMARERRWATTWRALSGNSTTARQANDLAEMPLGMRGILDQITNPGEAQRAAATQAGNILMGAPPAQAGMLPPGMPQDNPFARLLQISNPLLRGAAGGQGAAQLMEQR